MKSLNEKMAIGCEKCMGLGYTQSKYRHEDGIGLHQWAVLCECQPVTMRELEAVVNDEIMGGGDE